MPEEQEGILEVEEAEKVNLKERRKMLKEYASIWRQEEAEKVSNCNREKSQNPNQEKHTKWISIQHGTTTTKVGNNTRKWKPIDADFTSDHTGKGDRDGIKRLKQDTSDYYKDPVEMVTDTNEQIEVQDLLISASANRQADRTQ
ncbi:hypothetical protein ES332_D11G032300v1 [Gossypium tomentosum]|uniref:Uncharacterized protein n=1 Tax=Gossypium tomentosum TaxID=34277 RepID=A0A5D2IIK8_GOSTO|nr:hypothetical protein ES332_D11G032300v1 [Gossypium tomentosum]